MTDVYGKFVIVSQRVRGDLIDRAYMGKKSPMGAVTLVVSPISDMIDDEVAWCIARSNPQSVTE
jgi:hypothetical protein